MSVAINELAVVAALAWVTYVLFRIVGIWINSIRDPSKANNPEAKGSKPECTAHSHETPCKLDEACAWTGALCLPKETVKDKCGAFVYAQTCKTQPLCLWSGASCIKDDGINSCDSGYVRRKDNMAVCAKACSHGSDDTCRAEGGCEWTGNACVSSASAEWALHCERACREPASASLGCECSKTVDAAAPAAREEELLPPPEDAEDAEDTEMMDMAIDMDMSGDDEESMAMMNPEQASVFVPSLNLHARDHE